MPYIHTPVLMEEVLEALEPKAGGVFVDATLGLGGHAKRLLEAVGPTGHLIGVDQDSTALSLARENLREYEKQIHLAQGNFRDLARLVRELGFEKVDGVLMDLGISSMQVDDPQRGFSFASEARLDMRMDLGGYRTAWEVVNEYGYNDLVRIFKEYGEEPKAALYAKKIVEARREKRIDAAKELADIISPRAYGKIHPATRVFQAIRIEVNKELEVLRQALPQAVDLLRANGRLAVISFHSLEDRIVKESFKAMAAQDRGLVVNKKVITPKWSEQRVNRRSRSAKLRIFQAN